jgi:hypothetical protein
VVPGISILPGDQGPAVDDSVSAPKPHQLNEASIRRLLAAVHEALNVAIPARGRQRVAYLLLLRHRARIAQASIGRLISHAGSDELDFDSEADHIRQQPASLPGRSPPSW